MADEVILINTFEVPAEDAEPFIAAWEKTRDYLGWLCSKYCNAANVAIWDQ
ncbi:MAG TPA: hypothetical protein VGF32_18330 [Streptosporangiaceae bacterium]|jgi:hypothetical protein